MAADRVAAALLVLGNGLTASGLSAGSLARVRAAVSYPYVERVVFSGGWEQARSGAAEPPPGCREADLMRAAAVSMGMNPDVVRIECRSRSTLENLLHVAQDGLLDGLRLGPGRPLGLVTHAWHLPRARFLAGKVLGLRGAALVDVPASGLPRGGLFEYGVRAASRVCFLGVRDPAVLLRRERRMVTMLRRGV
ncbi:YdcF family protein [Actinoplanes sp. Pm04-4]|uniref:YdcF family protein n=1 Tax=Paractinoplanes pyxinae TaxID=2997416 RepID=A0ABT4B127_9ACTN|nr:YdcF family protein [Actinoplanes pyxinae]MCY1140191.1 YdcF family protein [Actinoplanes pyxinae]